MIPGNKKSETNINTYVLGFQEIDRSKFMAVGGKGANLGELSQDQGNTVCRRVFALPPKRIKK